MAKANKVKQLRFSLPSKVGLLSEVSSFITAAKINIEGICAYEMGEAGVFMLITDNNAKAKKVLSAMGAEIATEEIVTVALQSRCLWSVLKTTRSG